jgi:hypothetical protein
VAATRSQHIWAGRYQTVTNGDHAYPFRTFVLSNICSKTFFCTFFLPKIILNRIKLTEHKLKFIAPAGVTRPVRRGKRRIPVTRHNMVSLPRVILPSPTTAQPTDRSQLPHFLGTFPVIAPILPRQTLPLRLLIVRVLIHRRLVGLTTRSVTGQSATVNTGLPELVISHQRPYVRFFVRFFYQRFFSTE